MRRAWMCLVVVVLCARSAHADDPVLVSDLLKAIQRGINDAQADVQRLGPSLDSVTLQLQAESGKNANGGINLWFVKIGGSLESNASTQLTFVLKPAPPGNKNVAGVPLDTTIKDALVAAAKGVHDAQSPPNPIPLQLDSLTAEFAFTVKKSGSVGVKFDLLPVGGNLGAGVNRNDVHKITVKFAKAVKPVPAKQ